MISKTEGSSARSTLTEKYLQQFFSDNLKSKAHSERSSNVMPGGITRSVFASRPYPIYVESGRDCYLTSLDGVEYLDFVSQYFAGMFGHSHPAIKKAITEVLDTGFTFGAPHPRETDLAEAITSRFASMDMVQFTNSGTETNTMAIAAGLHYTKRKKVMVFDNAYHGTTLTFNYPNPLVLPHEFVFGTYNDIEATKKTLNSEVGVILIEPMQGAGGLIPASREFLVALREEATRLGAVLVFDEVITARTHYHGLQGYHNVIPDMTSLGKFFGGAFAFGAFGGRKEIMSLFDYRIENSLHHSGTNNNNPFTMAAGLAACKLLSKENIERTNALGEKLRIGLVEIFNSKQPERAIIRGFGSTVGLYFTGPEHETLRQGWYYFLLSKRIHPGPRGFFALGIVHEECHVQQVLDAAVEFCAEAFGQ